MGRKRFQNATLPERSSGGNAANHYHDEEAERYTSTCQTIQIQEDLTRRALDILNLTSQQGQAPALILDVGCGSGLSGKVITRATGLPWVGTDLAGPMLRLAQATAACQGRVILSDMGHGLPFRPEIFDAAMSISAVQWLCTAAQPKTASDAFFTSLYSCLKPGSTAALQIYVQDDADTALLVTAAVGAGFTGGYFVDYPHPSPAKKYYICLYKATSNRFIEPRDLKPAACCNLAWPRTGTCMLTWTQYLQSYINPSLRSTAASAVTLLRARLQHEHAHTARRTLRLLRRAIDQVSSNCPQTVNQKQRPSGLQEQIDHSQNGVANRPSNGSAPSNIDNANSTNYGQQDAVAGNSGGGDIPSDIFVCEAEVCAPALMPCHGAILVQLTALEDELPALAAACSPQTALEHPSPSPATHLNGGCTAQSDSDVEVEEGVIEASSIIQWLMACSPPPSAAAGSISSGCCKGADGGLQGQPVTVMDCAIRSVGAASGAATISVQRHAINWKSELMHAARSLLLTSSLQASSLGVSTNQEDAGKGGGQQSRKASSKSSKSFFWLEALQCETTGAVASACILHAHKLPSLLVIPYDGWGIGEVISGGGAPAAAVSELCRRVEGCVIAVDVRIRTERGCSSVWLIYSKGNILDPDHRQQLTEAVLQFDEAVSSRT